MNDKNNLSNVDLFKNSESNIVISDASYDVLINAYNRFLSNEESDESETSSNSNIWKNLIKSILISAPKDEKGDTGEYNIIVFDSNGKPTKMTPGFSDVDKNFFKIVYSTNPNTNETYATLTFESTSLEDFPAGSLISKNIGDTANPVFFNASGKPEKCNVSKMEVGKAKALSSINIGNETTPVYINSNGEPVACDTSKMEVAKAVSANSAEKIVLKGTGDSNGIGDSTTPVYFDAEGTPHPCDMTELTATKAKALTSKNVGSSTIPVYFNENGQPYPCEMSNTTAGKAKSLEVQEAIGDKTTPVYFDAEGTPHPCDMSQMPTTSIAAKAEALTSGKVGDSTTPVFFNAEGKPQQCDMSGFTQGTAPQTDALTSKNIGSSNIPVYFNSSGKPVACNVNTMTVKTAETASKAEKLTKSAGTSVTPIYINNNGEPTACNMDNMTVGNAKQFSGYSSESFLREYRASSGTNIDTRTTKYPEIYEVNKGAGKLPYPEYEWNQIFNFGSQNTNLGYQLGMAYNQYKSLKYRAKMGASTWKDWRTIIDSDNLDSFIRTNTSFMTYKAEFNFDDVDWNDYTETGIYTVWNKSVTNSGANQPPVHLVNSVGQLKLGTLIVFRAHIITQVYLGYWSANQLFSNIYLRCWENMENRNWSEWRQIPWLTNSISTMDIKDNNRYITLDDLKDVLTEDQVAKLSEKIENRSIKINKEEE